MSLTNCPISPTKKLSARAWQTRASDHATQIQKWTHPLLQRRARGQSHPVHDFLFTYYFQSPKKLEQWHPDFQTQLEDTPAIPSWLSTPPYHVKNGYRFANPATLTPKNRTSISHTLDLLRATASRTPYFACHGLHEWAMVYRGHEIRHDHSCPLRLPQSEIDQLVESRPLACSHYDAFRFFPPDAQPINRLQPTFDTRMNHEQPGCVHANMDLYKWAAKSMPWIGSDLLRECFFLAAELRELDMRASPYDLTSYGYQPIKIETPDGRCEYEQQQKHLASRAAQIRSEFIQTLETLLKAHS